MSKGRVWNKGKRNGGGGPAPGTGFKEKAKQASESTAEKAPLIPPVDLSDPKNLVKPMKRDDNRVTRPVRVKPSESSE